MNRHSSSHGDTVAGAHGDKVGVSAGDKVSVGGQLLVVSEEFAAQLAPGDEVLGVASTGQLRRIPLHERQIVSDAVGRARDAFTALTTMSDEQITGFFDHAAELLSDDAVFAGIRTANDADVQSARQRGRSVTRLELGDKMRRDMIAALRMWRDIELATSEMVSVIDHEGWRVEQWRAPLGVVAFVFEGRPNVFADATGVLRSGNTAVFRIGSDALGTARAIMSSVIRPALERAGLPLSCVELIDSAEHAAGWALFSDSRVSLAVARGSGAAVAELGGIAQQSGIPVSLHGTGGAWMLLADDCDPDDVAQYVEFSLDRKVCNTLNVVCVPRSRASELCRVIEDAADRAAESRGTTCRLHVVGDAGGMFDLKQEIDVARADGVHREKKVTVIAEQDLGHEHEWEESPEFSLVLVDSIDEAVALFNAHSPQFVASVVSRDPFVVDRVWRQLNAPFVGTGFTRWVDGQFALLAPELGLSNWQHGRLFGRSGILSGNSVFTVRVKAVQSDRSLHR